MAKPTKQRGLKTSDSAGTANAVTERITDPRFAHIQTSALYRLPSKKRDHVRVDGRFAHMLHDERFASRARVDRYGRRLQPSKEKNDLRKVYEDQKDDEPEGHVPLSEEDVELDDDEEVQKELERVERTYDPARDGGFSESSSDEDSTDDEEAKRVEGANDFPEQRGEAAPKGQVSSRLAIVNLDWDNIRATDLLAAFTSFVPQSERLLDVSVYPSEFGKERMEKEELEGPPKEIFAVRNRADAGRSLELTPDNGEEYEEEEEDEEKIRRSMVKEDQGEEFDSDRLRQYQLERLRYFYAVLTCSSNRCAEAIYDAVDGTEYLSTANFFDLRFIPDDMDFSDDRPRDKCDRVPDRYRPHEFVTDALQHSKVKLTWDADDVERKEAQRRAFSGSRADIDANDLKAYLGSDSSEDDEVNDGEEGNSVDDNDTTRSAPKEADRARTRALLGLGSAPATKKSREAGPVGDMQVTFASGLSGTHSGSVFENEPIEDETTVQKYVRKEKERKARRKEKMKLARSGVVQEEVEMASDENGTDDHDQDLGFDDPFFTEPSNNKSETAARRKEQKQRQREERAVEEANAASKKAELELLMVDENDDVGDIKHFDAKQLERGEKIGRKKKAKGKLSARHQAALEAKEQDTFAMDLQDPRFAAVYERSDFAVDPSHPRYKDTEGMKALLQETRRKRSRGDGSMDKDERTTKQPRRELDDDVNRLVERVKGKTARRSR